MEIDIKKWNDWANRSSFLFSGIKDNRKIGILIDSIEDKLIILLKKRMESMFHYLMMSRRLMIRLQI